MQRTIFIFLLVTGLLLSACFEEPKLQADTEANFNTSFAILTKDMNSADREKLDAALKDIVLVEVGMYGPMLDAKSYQRPSSQADTPFGQAFTKGFTGVMTAALNKAWRPIGMEIAPSWSWKMRGRSLTDTQPRKSSSLPKVSERKVLTRHLPSIAINSQKHSQHSMMFARKPKRRYARERNNRSFCKVLKLQIRASHLKNRDFWNNPPFILLLQMEAPFLSSVSSSTARCRHRVEPFRGSKRISPTLFLVD